VLDGNESTERTPFHTAIRRIAKNVILFIGDGMGVSPITATRVYSVGVAGQLIVDQFPYTALSPTYSSDSITPDSAPTMTAMMTGQNTNGGVIGRAVPVISDARHRGRQRSALIQSRPKPCCRFASHASYLP
jgi:alkaline phosphatase